MQCKKGDAIVHDAEPIECRTIVVAGPGTLQQSYGKKAARHLIVLTIVGAACLSLAAQEAVKEESPEKRWTVYIEDGKSAPMQVALLPAGSPVEHYRDNLSRISSWNLDDIPEDERQDPFAPEHLRVTAIGKWHGLRIYDVVSELLPEGTRIPKGGGFDVKTLTYRSDVWQEGDGNCCPIAGRVELDLEIKNCTLVILHARYTPQARAVRAESVE